MATIDNISFCGFTKEEFDKLPNDTILGYIHEYPFEENGLKYKGRKSGYVTKEELLKKIEL